MEQDRPRKRGRAFDEWEERQTDGREDQAQGDQFRFAHFFHRPANGTTLHHGANDPAVRKEVNHRGRGSLVGADVQMEIVADEQRQGALETTETKRREEKNHDEQTDPGLGERVKPLVKVRALRDVLGSRLAAFDQDEAGEEEVRGA